ncbi:MAG TPA: hypothetical protein VF590_18890 [Isosphaeraceae bacterium]
MPDAVRPTSRLEPVPAWTEVTDAPLRGLVLAREAGIVFAWDEGDLLYQFDARGARLGTARAPGRIVAGVARDDGSLFALLGEGARLWLLGPDLETIADRSAPPDATALAVDPHGRYVAVASRLGLTQLYQGHGRQAGRFETKQHLTHLHFVADRPVLIGAGGHGSIVGVELAAAGAEGRLRGEVLWQHALLSNVGRLAATGDGGLVLLSCFTHGIQRFDLRGHNEGSYHPGGSVAHAVPDFAGRLIAVATLEGELAILNPAGNVRWTASAPRPAIALEADALGRYLVYGQATGEITRLDLEGPSRPASASPAASAVQATPRAETIRPPAWAVPVAPTDEQAEAAVLAVLDDPPRIAYISRGNRLQIHGPDGAALGRAPEILGVGRIVRTAPGWIAAATDRQVVLYDARRNAASRLDLSLVEITHLAIRPDGYGLAVVQERDRIGRATPAGRWIWKAELDAPVEELAIGPEGLTAVTTDDGRLRIFDPAGEPLAAAVPGPVEPLLLAGAPTGSPPEVAWLTLARRRQVLRGHARDARVLWETPVPWEAWQLHPIGPVVVVAAPDGRALAFDGSGYLRAQSRAGAPPSLFCAGPTGVAYRVVRQDVHLICTELPGRVAWRHVAAGTLGPIAAGRSGVAALLGRSLAWFPTPGGP